MTLRMVGLSPSNRDRLITELAKDLYETYKGWERRKRNQLLVIWIKLPKDKKQSWKKLAEMIINSQEKEEQVVK
jgi:hypothetical protein